MDTTQMPAKMIWTKPQLLVLVRSKPEEAVLINCKANSTSGSPGTDDLGCGTIIADCAPCLALGSS